MSLAGLNTVVVDGLGLLTQEALPLKPCPLLVNEVPYAPPTSPHTPLSLKLGTAHTGAKGRRGEARATCQSISDCSPRPKTIGEHAALGCAHRGALRQHRRPTFLGVAVCDARPRVPDRRWRQRDSSVFKGLAVDTFFVETRHVG